jgi:hypothetical protein
LFARKALAKNNVLVGDDRAQLRFMEQCTGVEAVTVEKITDDAVLGQDGLLLRVYASHRVDLSPDVKAKTGIWSADSILRGSSGANAIVKQAAVMLGLQKIDHEIVEQISWTFPKEGIDDIRGSLWHSIWSLTGEVRGRPKWVDPWKDPIAWMDPADPAHRLHSLYRSLVGWTYLAYNDLRGVKQFGISPSQQQFLKQQKLDFKRVYESIRVLSAWKMSHSDPFVCALRISSIWS